MRTASGHQCKVKMSGSEKWPKVVAVQHIQIGGHLNRYDKEVFDVIFQKRVRVFYRGFQTREN